MYYWSRWTNITTETEIDRERTSRPSRQDTGYRQVVRRDTRPVVVVRRSPNTQPLSTTANQRHRSRVSETSPNHISLDIQRARTTSTHPLRRAGEMTEATTEDL